MKIKLDPDFQSIWPALSRDELDGLRESIREDGILSPLIVWKETGILLEGHHRYQLAKELKVDYQVVEVSIVDREAAAQWIYLYQLNRRNLTDFQRLEGAANLEKFLGREAESRGKTGKSPDPEANLPQGSRLPQTRDRIGQLTGLSGRTVQDGKKVIRDAAERVKELARKGEIGISTAAAISELPKPDQRAIASKGPEAVRAAVKSNGEKVADEFPWSGFNAELDKAIVLLRQAGGVLRNAMEVKDGRCNAKWAKYFLPSSTNGACNAIIRTLEQHRPAELSKREPGFLTQREVDAMDKR